MVKLVLVTTMATGLILLIYHYFVRSTFIGEQLNGRDGRNAQHCIQSIPRS